MRKLITIFKLSIHTVMPLIKIFDFIRGELISGAFKRPLFESLQYVLCNIPNTIIYKIFQLCPFVI